jgi:hypothetical protein
MNIGMLWFDNDTKADLKTKVYRAADYYQRKYGKAPNLCFVHPSMVNGDNSWQNNGIELRTTRSVLPNHYWLGVQQNGG